MAVTPAARNHGDLSRSPLNKDVLLATQRACGAASYVQHKQLRMPSPTLVTDADNTRRHPSPCIPDATQSGVNGSALTRYAQAARRT